MLGCAAPGSGCGSSGQEMDELKAFNIEEAFTPKGMLELKAVKPLPHRSRLLCQRRSEMYELQTEGDLDG